MKHKVSICIAVAFALTGLAPISPLSRIRRHIPALEPVAFASDHRDLSGHFTSTPPELRAKVSALGGRDLYLLPDGAYFLTEWGCVLSETIFDRGTWSVAGGTLILLPDVSVKWRVSTDRKYAVLRHSGRPDEVLLLGLVDRLPYFEAHASDDPEFMLLICGLVRTERLTKHQANGIRKKLLLNSWNPEFFKIEPRAGK